MHSKHSGSFTLCLQHVSVGEVTEWFFASQDGMQEFGTESSCIRTRHQSNIFWNSPGYILVLPSPSVTTLTIFRKPGGRRMDNPSAK